MRSTRVVGDVLPEDVEVVAVVEGVSHGCCGSSMLGQYTRVRRVAGAALTLALSHDGRGDFGGEASNLTFSDNL